MRRALFRVALAEARGDGAASTSTPDAPEMVAVSAASAPTLPPETASGAPDTKKQD